RFGEAVGFKNLRAGSVALSVDELLASRPLIVDDVFDVGERTGMLGQDMLRFMVAFRLLLGEMQFFDALVMTFGVLAAQRRVFGFARGRGMRETFVAEAVGVDG